MEGLRGSSGALGQLLGGSQGLLGGSLGVLGGSWDDLGRVLQGLGCLLGDLGEHGAVFKRSERILDGFECARASTQI